MDAVIETFRPDLAEDFALPPPPPMTPDQAVRHMVGLPAEPEFLPPPPPKGSALLEARKALDSLSKLEKQQEALLYLNGQENLLTTRQLQNPDGPKARLLGNKEVMDFLCDSSYEELRIANGGHLGSKAVSTLLSYCRNSQHRNLKAWEQFAYEHLKRIARGLTGD